MVTSIIGLLVSLVILYIVYLLVEWVLGFIEIVPPIFKKILYLIFVVIAVVIVLNFLGTLIGFGSFHSLK